MATGRTKGGGRRTQATGRGRGRGGWSPPELPGWAWLLAGVALGFGAAFLVRLPLEGPAGPPAERPAAQAEGPEEGAAAGTGERGPRFEFYTLLPEEEVVVPEGEPRRPAPSAEDPESAAAPDAGEPPPGPYLLQAGSFRSAGDADGLKASLALLGVEADIHSVELEGGEVWHRVRVGPFEDRERLDRVRARLEDNGIKTLVLRQRG